MNVPSSAMPSGGGRLRGSRTVAKVVPPTLAALLVIAAWQIGSSSGALSTAFFSSPLKVVVTALSELGRPSFWVHAWVTTQEFGVGYLVGIGLAVPFGLVVGWVRRLHALLDPWINAMNATPRIALFPLVLVWLGLGFEAKVAIVFLGVFVTVAINTLQGTSAVAREHLDVADVFRAGAAKRFLTVVVPTAVPFMLTGMRLGVGRAATGVLVAEYFTSQAGLGHYIFNAGQRLQIDKVMFGAAFITLVTLAAFGAITRLEKRFTAWRPEVGSA